MITKENLKKAVSHYVDDVFNSLSLNADGVMGNLGLFGKKIALKMAIETKFDLIDPLLNDQKMLDLEKLKEIAMPEIEKMGKIEVAGIRFDKSDFIDLFKKIGEYDHEV